MILENSSKNTYLSSLRSSDFRENWNRASIDVVNSSYSGEQDLLVEEELDKVVSEQIRAILNDKNNKKVKLILEVEGLLDRANSDDKQKVQIPEQRIKDVLSVVKQWPDSLTIPYLDVDEDGVLYLYVFDENGIAVVGLLFNGDKNMFAYSIDAGGRKSSQGECNAQNNSDLMKFIRKVSNLLG